MLYATLFSGQQFYIIDYLSNIMTIYKPLLSKKEIEERKIWQEDIYKKLKSIKKEKIVTVIEKEIIVLPGVFAPVFEVLKTQRTNHTSQKSGIFDDYQKSIKDF